MTARYEDVDIDGSVLDSLKQTCVPEDVVFTGRSVERIVDSAQRGESPGDELACFGRQLLDAQDVWAMQSEESFQGWTPLGPPAGAPKVVGMGDEGEGRHGFGVLEYLEECRTKVEASPFRVEG